MEIKTVIVSALILPFLAIPSEPVVYIATPTETILAEVTAYSEFDSCHYENCIMASGKRAYVGALACPRNISLETRVFIDGKEYVCEDRTNKDLNGRFDIFMGYGKESYQKAIEFGLQRKNVVIHR